MPHTKKAKENKPKAPEEIIEKPKRGFDFETGEILIPDKVEDEEALEDSEMSEESGEAAEFDEEELNPFKDKWEE